MQRRRNASLMVGTLELARRRLSLRGSRNPMQTQHGRNPLLSARIARPFSESRTVLRTFSATFTRHDFSTATSHHRIVIFLLTSFFNNSMFQIVATKQRCEFSMKNGRENRNQWQPRKRQRRKRSIKQVQ